MSLWGIGRMFWDTSVTSTPGFIPAAPIAIIQMRYFLDHTLSAVKSDSENGLSQYAVLDRPGNPEQDTNFSLKYSDRPA